MAVRAGEPWSPRGRRPLGAHVSGVAAVWVWRRVERDVADSMQHFMSTGQPEVARAIGEAAAELREASAQWQASRDVSGVGSAETVEVREPAESEVPAGSLLPGAAVDVAEAADLLEVSGRRVRQLVADGSLAGSKDRAGRWLVDREDVEQFRADRRLAA